MALAGNGVLAIWNGIAPHADTDFVTWHIREHIPERVGVPGFLRGRRYIALQGNPKYFNFYETASPDVLNSAAYVERLNNPSPWTKRVVQHFEDTSRTICTVSESKGLGDGAVVATLKLVTRSDRETFRREISTRIMGPLMEAESIIAVHLLEGQGGGANGQTVEKELRKQPDHTAAWILLVEAADARAIAGVLTGPMSENSLSSAGATLETSSSLGVYQLQYSLSESQLA